MSNWTNPEIRARILTVFSKMSELRSFIAAAVDFVASETILPGPTGELNRLTHAPRGRFICDRADGNAELHIGYICAALMAGNLVTITGKDAANIADSLHTAGVPKTMCKSSRASLESLIQTQDMSGVTLCADAQTARLINRALAARDGEIVQLIWNAPLLPHIMSRFLTEKTITLNTAAIGGNAALLGISEHP